MENVAEKLSNYRAFQYHFGDLVIEKVGKDDYIAHRPGSDAWENWLQRGTKEYINGWLYGAVMRECGQIHKEPPDSGDEECDHYCETCEERAICNASTYKSERVKEMEAGEAAKDKEEVT